MGGKSWLRTAGFEQAQLRGEAREGGKSEGAVTGFSRCIAIGEGLAEIPAPPEHAHPGAR